MDDVEKSGPMAAPVEPKIGIEFDSQSNAIFVITCQRCGVVHRNKMSALSDGSKIACDCGAVYTITGDSLVSGQRSIDDLKRTIKNFGK